MKNWISGLLLFLCIGGHTQSADGEGETLKRTAEALEFSKWAQQYDDASVIGEKSKYKEGILARSFQWLDYQQDDTTYRIRRGYDVNQFMYDEHLIQLSPEAIAKVPDHFVTVRTKKNKIFVTEPGEDDRFVYHGKVEVFDDEVLQSTLYFDKGFLYKMHINHYYFSNGQLQFVREITREQQGEPFRNTGVLEAYYLDGRPFEDPITEDGKAIIILNDEGEPEDTCQCMDQDIMPWGEAYLSAFIGKFYAYLSNIYQQEGLECCWE